MESMPDPSKVIHFITACKGRLSMVQQTIEAAIAQPHSTYTFVDYSCPEKSGEWVSANFPQANVIFVKGRQLWHASEARNIAAAAINDGWLCFLDSDILLSPEFAAIVRAMLKPGIYIAPPCNPGICGMLVCTKADFERCGGYDEIIRGWGWEDEDLRHSLNYIGATYCAMPEQLLKHIDHADELRTNNCEVREKKMSHMANSFYGALKRFLRQVHGSVDTEELRRAYRYSKDRLHAGYPWRCWYGAETPSDLVSTVLTIAGIAVDFEGISTDYWGSVRSFRLKGRTRQLREIFTTYDRQTIKLCLPGNQQEMTLMQLDGQTRSIPVQNGVAAFDLTIDPVFVPSETELFKDIMITVEPAAGPAVAVILEPCDGFQHEVIVEVVTGKDVRKQSGINLKAAPVRLEFPLTDKNPEQPRSVLVRVRDNATQYEVVRNLTFPCAGYVSQEETASSQPPDHIYRYPITNSKLSQTLEIAWGWTETDLVCWLLCREGISFSDVQHRLKIDIAVDPENIKPTCQIDYVFSTRECRGKYLLEAQSDNMNQVQVLDDTVTIADTAQGARIAMRLPFSILGITPQAGHVLGISFLFQCDEEEDRVAWGTGLGGPERNPWLYNHLILSE